jgi:AAA domain
VKRATDIPEEWLMRPQERNGRPHTFTVAELMRKELPPVREVVPGVVPEGVSLLVGKPKMRKTFTALGLCISVATGGFAFGKIPVERGEALFLALEDNERRLQKRLGVMIHEGADLTGFHIALEWPRLDEVVSKSWRRRLLSARTCDWWL